ncbi:MAG: DUF1653 domain-containing protein [Candidatus Thorarchaeota archaeon]|jgi:hypothetical protein
MDKPICGRRYSHFKGGIYRVHFIAQSADTKEDMVIYESLTHGGFWARRLDDWNEHVVKPEYSYQGHRFVLMEEKADTYIPRNAQCSECLLFNCVCFA